MLGGLTTFVGQVQVMNKMLATLMDKDRSVR